MFKKSNFKPGSKVWIAARHSPGNEQTIDAQLNGLIEYCEQNSLVIIDRFIDAGVSGNSRERDGFNRLLKIILESKRPLVAGVIFWESARMARDWEMAQFLRWAMKYHDYKLEYVIEDTVEGLPGAILEMARDYENEKYLEKIRINSQNGLRTFVTLQWGDGTYCNCWAGQPPWGFRGIQKEIPMEIKITGKKRVRQCIEPDYEKWELGRRLFELRLQGYTYQEIEQKTGWLKLRGTPSGGYNLDVMARSYWVFFSNPIYYGTLKYKDLTIENWIEPMVSREVWEAANHVAINDHRGNWKRSPRAGKGSQYTLAGLCECGLCSAPFYTRRTKEWRYYHCATKQRYGWNKCESRLIGAVDLEMRVIDHAYSHYLTGDFINLTIEKINCLVGDANSLDDQIRQIQTNIDNLTGQIKSLVDLARLTGDIAEIATQVRGLEQQRALNEWQLKELLTKPTGKIVIRPEKIELRLRSLKEDLTTPSEAKAVLNQIINKVILWPQQAKICYKLLPGLEFSDNYPSALVANYQDLFSYTIQLPSRAYK